MTRLVKGGGGGWEARHRARGSSSVLLPTRGPDTRAHRWGGGDWWLPARPPSTPTWPPVIFSVPQSRRCRGVLPLP